MPFLDLEQSVSDGEPVHVLTLSSPYIGIVVCNATIPGNVSYTPCPFTFSRIRPAAGKDVTTMQVSMPLNHPATQAIVGQFHDDVAVGIARYHQPDAIDQKTIWTGRLDQWTVQKQQLQITAVSLYDRMRQQHATLRTSRTCQWDLYGTECGKVPAEQAYTVDSIAASRVNLTTTLEAGLSTHITPGGRARFGFQTRPIINRPAEFTVTLTHPFNDMVASDTIYILPGCDKSTLTCISYYDNFDRYGGFPYKPAKALFEV